MSVNKTPLVQLQQELVAAGLIEPPDEILDTSPIDRHRVQVQICTSYATGWADYGDIGLSNAQLGGRTTRD